MSMHAAYNIYVGGESIQNKGRWKDGVKMYM
jgi:hypothetical protein